MGVETLVRFELPTTGFECPDLSEARVRQLVDDINTDGIGVIPGFLNEAFLARARSFVGATVAASGGNYVGLQGPDAVAGSGLEEVAHSAAFRRLMERVYQLGTGQTPPGDAYYQLLRCLTGQSVGSHSYFYHYDSYVITVLLPIAIPTTGMTGDFLLIPNTRPIRRFYLQNAFDKLLLDNKVTQKILKFLTLRGWRKVKRLKLVPGNAYFFWGYRTIHANEPCDSNSVRATALFHYVNQHKNGS
jgi:hypothetical protein